MNSFISPNNDFMIAPGVYFPVQSILGIIAYPVNTKSTAIFLKKIQVVRAPKFDNYQIMFVFQDNRGNDLMKCITEQFSVYKNIKDDYKLDFTDITGTIGCGCMVVSPPFIQWLLHLSQSIEIAKGLQINPTYVYTPSVNIDNLISVNGVKIKEFVFTNAHLTDKGEVTILSADSEELLEDTPHYMTALRIKGSNTQAVLTGKSIGFTITPASSSNDTHCRVHINTTSDNIHFIDQGTGL